MTTTTAILKQLKSKRSSENVAGMARYGMNIDKRLGIPVPELRSIARATGKDHPLALALWKTGIAEARIVASMIAVPQELTAAQMQEWVQDFNSWDVCDQVCLNLFDKTPFARDKILEWSERPEEFVKRAAFALIAGLAWHDKNAPDGDFIDLLPVIVRGATDDRNFVKKAVNWALRSIGKRNSNLNKAAIKTAKQIQQLDSKAARWVGADALRELQGESAEKRLARAKTTRPSPPKKNTK